MNMVLTRAKVKAERVADAEACIKRLASAYEQAHLNGRNAWFRLDDGVTFVILSAYDQGATPPTDMPEYQALLEIIKTAVDGQLTNEPLTMIESYRIF